VRAPRARRALQQPRARVRPRQQQPPLQQLAHDAVAERALQLVPAGVQDRQPARARAGLHGRQQARLPDSRMPLDERIATWRCEHGIELGDLCVAVEK
jgi:hypothetical protein